MDDDTSDGSPRRRSQPTRNLPSRQAKLNSRKPLRATRSTAAYFSSPGSEQISCLDTDHGTPLRRSPRIRRSARNRAKPAAGVKRRRIQSPGKASLLRRPKTPVDAIPDGPKVFPPWVTLPYHVWLSVFDFVAAPIRGTTSRVDNVGEAVHTLISGARTCRVLLEPALAGLYKCPPFQRPYLNKPSHVSFMHFVNVLALPPSETMVTYRPKVETLRIDVDAFLSRKVNGAHLTLQKVLSNLPRLSSLELFHPADDPPYRDLKANLRWRVSERDLLGALMPSPTTDRSTEGRIQKVGLRSWRWNSRLVPDTLSLERLPTIHSLPSFRGLRKVAFINYQLPSLTQFPARARESQEAQDQDAQAVAHLAASISALPDLQHLIIESSALANGSLLERLPKGLSHLELVNCWEITSEDMSAFLKSHGHSLVHLTLKHCQSLSLGFLPVLGTSCRNLAHLEVVLSYYRHHAAYADNKPEYARLLEEDQVPTWPSSLQSIELINMRNWTRGAAEMFFSSLTQNAKALPNLRRLEFKVILNIEWRQRQELRRSLADKMTRTFKRKWRPPREQAALHHAREATPTSPDIIDFHTPVRRRSSRIMDQSTTLVSSTNKAGSSQRGRGSGSGNWAKDLDFPLGQNTKPVRCVSAKFDADDEDSSEDELAMCDTPPRRKQSRTTAAKNTGLQVEFIHGLCDVVDIQIDNQRPAERQFEMDDFVDSVEVTDPEWNSENDDMD
ncbi:hypothetical protein GGS20DRAFT_553900 [Poronia punctata]|nr:hypothetical protein GGS20DRAFT_553900 [Poronia punctata]